LLVGPPTTTITQAEVDAITPAQLESLVNRRFGTKTQSFISADSPAAIGASGYRLVFAYHSSANALTSITSGSSFNQISAFKKGTNNKTITTASGSSQSYIYYVSNATNSWNGTVNIS
jgi:hypothetical protein